MPGRKPRERKEISILDLGAGRKPKWLARIAKRSPSKRFEAVDTRMTTFLRWLPRNLRRTRANAIKRLKQMPSNSISVMTANLSLAVIFEKRLSKQFAELFKAKRIMEKEPNTVTLEKLSTVLKALTGLPEIKPFTPSFLKEVKRVLKPNGSFVIVTVKTTAPYYEPQLEKDFSIIRTQKLSKEWIERRGTASMKWYSRKGFPLVKMICKPK